MAESSCKGSLQVMSQYNVQLLLKTEHPFSHLAGKFRFRGQRNSAISSLTSGDSTSQIFYSNYRVELDQGPCTLCISIFDLRKLLAARRA